MTEKEKKNILKRMIEQSGGENPFKKSKRNFKIRRRQNENS